MSLRIVYLTHSARLSGAELGLAELLPELEGVEPHVILAEDGRLVAHLQQAGIPLEVLPLAESTRSLPRGRMRLEGLPLRAGVDTMGYAWRLARRLRRLRTSLVHASSLKAIVYGTIAARLAGVPVVWHLHDRLSDDYLPRPAVRILRAFGSRAVAGVIANSWSTFATLSADQQTRAAVIYEPVRSPGDGELGSRETTGPFVAGVVGRIAPWKGQHVFLEAFARAFPAGPERGVVIGAPMFGEDEYGRELHDQRRRLGLDGRIEFTGFRDNVYAELGRLDALVHTSVTPEPFGRVIVEGMAAGLPVAASRAGGPLEYVDDGVNGFLYPPGNAQELANLLKRLALDPGLRARVGGAARASVGRFAPEVIARQTTRFYLRTLGAQ